jgi:hypothetical protein
VRGWLAICSVLPLAAATGAHAQIRALMHSQTQSPPHAANFALSTQSWTNDPPPFADGMITTDKVAPETIVGIGLVRMHGRKRNGSDFRTGAPAVQTRNPAVTFVLKF